MFPVFSVFSYPGMLHKEGALNQSEVKQNWTNRDLLARVFLALAWHRICEYLSSSDWFVRCCLSLLWLATVITLVLFLRHVIEIHSLLALTLHIILFAYTCAYMLALMFYRTTSLIILWEMRIQLDPALSCCLSSGHQSAWGPSKIDCKDQTDSSYSRQCGEFLSKYKTSSRCPVKA